MKKDNIIKQTHIIDAADKTLGRLATEIAKILIGKHKVNFLPNKNTGEGVIVKNINKLKFTGKKFFQKKYYRHTKYPGHLKIEKLDVLFKKDPAKVLKHCVSHMLPKNKLMKIRIKNLKIE